VERGLAGVQFHRRPIAQDDLNAAVAHYHASLDTRERLAAAGLDNAEWQRAVWVSCDWRICRRELRIPTPGLSTTPRTP
jgi:hypothetical protein